jgi:pectate lyase
LHPAFFLAREAATFPRSVAGSPRIHVSERGCKMNGRRIAMWGSVLGSSVFITVSAVAGGHGGNVHWFRAACLAHEVLEPNDGWASLDAGTSGGSAAVPEQIYVVTTRAEFIAALNNGVPSVTSPSTPSAEPKIIYVRGTLDFNVDEANQPLECADYYVNGYTPEAFAAAFDPAVWGRTAPTGPLETARAASQQAQQARIRIRVGSNTTIVGLGKRATLRGVWLDIRGTASQNVSNIIIRNLAFEDTFDCFPVWSPTDGALGSWNAAYDSVSLRNADHVWVDHNTFRDRDTRDELQPQVFGVLFQGHDGQLDITNASDLVTVSYNRFWDHDKVMLIGSSDSAAADRGKLRVTLHHNWFRNTGQRTPRVRFGQVDIYNNYYEIRDAAEYQYTWGAGIESAIVAENNFFATAAEVTPDRFISRLNGTALFEAGTLVNGVRRRHQVDVVAAWNALNDPDLTEEVGWLPTLRADLDPARVVPEQVRRRAGTFDW